MHVLPRVYCVIEVSLIRSYKLAIYQEGYVVCMHLHALPGEWGLVGGLILWQAKCMSVCMSEHTFYSYREESLQKDSRMF